LWYNTHSSRKTKPDAFLPEEDMRKTIVWAVVLVVALGVGISLYLNKSQDVQTSEAVLHDFTTFIEGAGTVDAPTQTIIVPSSGLVKSVLVKEGQHISAGDALLVMDDGALRLQLQEAVLALNAQKKAFNKQNGDLTRSEQEGAMAAAQTVGYGLEQFNSTEMNPETQDVGQEQVDMARLKVEQAEDMLEHATVYSAISGTVLSVSVREGELSVAGYQAAVVAAMNDIEVDTIFADLDASSIRPGMEVQFYGGCLGSATCGGTVSKIVPLAQTQQSQTGQKSVAVIKVKPDNPALFGRLGASVELKVVTGRINSVGVPIEALAQDSSGLYVYVVRRGRAYRTDVEVGVLDEYYAEVKSGLHGGDVVALNPTDLRNGQKVSGS
jgi:RND family efflux transporter MFP subunit